MKGLFTALTAFIKKLIRTRIFRVGVMLTIIAGIALFASNYWVSSSTSEKIYADLESVPANDVGLVLGANKRSWGGINLYFANRIEAAVSLFKAGKIKHIIVSGDNHRKGYDEPTDMRDALIERGIPDSCITLDYAGFRTLDSMVRCKEVFGQEKVTVISQKFHNERAVFIAERYDIDAIAFNAKDVPSRYSLKTMVREYFARLKAVLDLYVLGTDPKFLGEKVEIKI